MKSETTRAALECIGVDWVPGEIIEFYRIRHLALTETDKNFRHGVLREAATGCQEYS